MDITAEDFRRHFDLLSDETLLATNRDELIEIAQLCYDEEVAKRGLDLQSPDSEPEVHPAETLSPEPDPDQEDMVVLGTYDNPEEAELAKAALDEARIPASLVSNPDDMEGLQMELLVPTTALLKALDVLGMHISDEELAAQAEAAGLQDDGESD